MFCICILWRKAKQFTRTPHDALLDKSLSLSPLRHGNSATCTFCIVCYSINRSGRGNYNFLKIIRCYSVTAENMVRLWRVRCLTTASLHHRFLLPLSVLSSWPCVHLDVLHDVADATWSPVPLLLCSTIRHYCLLAVRSAFWERRGLWIVHSDPQLCDLSEKLRTSGMHGYDAKGNFLAYIHRLSVLY